MALTSFSLPLDTPDDTDRLGQALAQGAIPGDCILLRGQIGAGKSALARAYIRAAVGAEIDVPSPTFTLVQTYDARPAEIWHADLYRLTDPSEAIELGLLDAFETGICLVEWPELLGDMAPLNALDIHLVPDGDGRLATLTAGPYWADRLKGLQYAA